MGVLGLFCLFSFRFFHVTIIKPRFERSKRFCFTTILMMKPTVSPSVLWNAESVGGCLYEATINVPTQPMLFWYDFIIATPNGVMHYGTSADQLGGEGLCSYDQPASYQVTVYDPDYTTPTFLR